MNLKYLIALLILSINLVSCGTDEPELPQPNTPIVDNPKDEEDTAKYDIVGSWRAQYKWSSSIETINLDINRDGTLSYISTNDTYDQDPIVGNGTWEYNTTKHMWDLSTGYSMISGTYSLVGRQLIIQTYYDNGSSRTVVYNKVNN